MSDHPDFPPRLMELLADRALWALEAPEASELEQLLRQYPHIDTQSLERVVATLEDGSDAHSNVPLPQGLVTRILARAKGSHGSTDANSARQPLESRQGDMYVSRADVTRPGQSSRPNQLPEYLGWMAAAACLLLAAMSWLRPQSGPVSFSPVAAAQARTAILRDAEHSVQCNWQAQEDPASVGTAGDVVWNESQQQGFMRFQGLAANDPQAEQYQLWIFDASQDPATPIDGGVFDIPAGQEEVIVPIHPKLRVRSATMFAITVEKPGGVVVSKRTRLPLLATLVAKR